MTFRNFFTLLIALALFMQPVSLLADSAYRGKVLKFNGEVDVVNAKGEKRSVQKVDEPLSEMDTIVTGENSRIVVQFDDGALSVLDEKSRLRVEKTSWFSYLGGKVYFTFKKVFGPQRNVKTRAATLGIRGTTFIIKENAEMDGESVALKEGLLQVESTGPAFEIHKQREMNEYERYRMEQMAEKQQMQDEFDEYKKQTMREFVEYRRQFTLKPNRVIRLSGYRIDETAMSDSDKADFEAFESEAEDLIEEFRSRSKALIAH
jgi:ferric-dicitrate binding protein FerR (iron transport regulator)